MRTCIHVSYICFITKHINHLFAGQKQLLGMWITKNGKNYCTIYMCNKIYRKALDRCKHTIIQHIYDIQQT